MTTVSRRRWKEIFNIFLGIRSQGMGDRVTDFQAVCWKAARGVLGERIAVFSTMPRVWMRTRCCLMVYVFYKLLMIMFDLSAVKINSKPLVPDPLDSRVKHDIPR